MIEDRITADTALPAGRRYVRVRVADIVEETLLARSFRLEVPEGHADAFAYEAGQFLTLRATIDGVEQIRCYSMSSAPATDDAIRVTVKRQPGGVMSTWLTEQVTVGSEVEVLPPSGDFTLRVGTNDIVAFASGSGITPVLALVKSALASTVRKVRLFYANQNRDAVIFERELSTLTMLYRHRFSVVHHVYDEHGYVTSKHVCDFLRSHVEPDVYVCGSRRFTDTVLTTLATSGQVVAGRVFVESFTPGETPAPRSPAGDATGVLPVVVPDEVVVKLRGRRHTVPYVRGETFLETARRAGLAAPFSCEAGTCASCMAMVKRGEVTMSFNSVLTPQEVEEGWVLTCQGYPASMDAFVEYPD